MRNRVQSLFLTGDLGSLKDGSPHASHEQVLPTPPPDAHYRDGDDNHNCGGCAFFSDGVCDVWSSTVEANKVCNSYQSPADAEGDGDQGNGVGMAELHKELYFSNGDVSENDGLVWKTVLRTGTWKYRPGAGQVPVLDPLQVIEGNSPDPTKIIGLTDIVDAWNDKAVEHVTTPLTHEDRSDQNTGFVRKLLVEDDPKRPGQKILKAGLEFTEEDIKGKAQRGTIANTSVGLAYNYIRKSDGKKYPIAMRHVALTNHPWIDGMDPFGGLEASDDTKIQTYEFSEAPEPTDKKLDAEALQKLFADQVNNNLPAKFTVEFSDGEMKVSVIEETTEEESGEESQGSATVNVQPQKETDMADIEGLEGLELSDDARQKVAELLAQKNTESEELVALRKERREAKADARVEELKGLGLSEQPGFLKVVRQVLLADGAATTLELSDEGKSETISFTDVVNRLIDSLPVKDGKINFGEQAESLGTDQKPVKTTEDENKTAKQRADEARDYLYGPAE